MVEGGGLNTSPVGLARAPPPQQTGLLPESSSPFSRYCHQSRATDEPPPEQKTPLPAYPHHAPAAAAAARSASISPKNEGLMEVFKFSNSTLTALLNANR
jgi:hypothetical protein